MSGGDTSSWKRLATCVALAGTLWLAGADVALGAPKKKAEAPAEPTKSYTVPYALVLLMLGIGLMTVCRPTGRLEKVDDKLKKESES
jgi:hypothetical protein